MGNDLKEIADTHLMIFAYCHWGAFCLKYEIFLLDGYCIDLDDLKRVRVQTAKKLLKSILNNLNFMLL